ncbi:MAG: His/Gly/Thr/Pro-type tRNA ligase C-terminal domain-containing protein, partial [Anaerovoracaceae bacterium]
IPNEGGTDVFIVMMGDKAKKYGLGLVSELRARGINTQIDLLSRNIKGQMKNADRTGAGYAVIVGDNEIEKGIISVKVLAESRQIEVPMDEITEMLCRELGK